MPREEPGGRGQDLFGVGCVEETLPEEGGRDSPALLQGGVPLGPGTQVEDHLWRIRSGHGEGDAGTLSAMDRLLVLLLFVLPGLGCGGGAVAISGYDMKQAFPRADERFWQFDNDAYTEQVWWIADGTTAPAGEDWITHTWWFVEQADLVDDWLGAREMWAIKSYWADRANGVYWMGWTSNPTGPLADQGESLFEGDGVPFAMASARRGQEWTSTAGGHQWTTVADDEAEVLEFNSQHIEGAWRITVTSDLGDTPMEGPWWLVSGPGIVQWDAQALRPPQGTAWQHYYNDILGNLLGAE